MSTFLQLCFVSLLVFEVLAVSADITICNGGIFAIVRYTPEYCTPDLVTRAGPTWMQLVQ